MNYEFKIQNCPFHHSPFTVHPLPPAVRLTWPPPEAKIRFNSGKLLVLLPSAPKQELEIKYHALLGNVYGRLYHRRRFCAFCFLS